MWKQAWKPRPWARYFPIWAATAAPMKKGVPCLMVSTSFTSESPEKKTKASTMMATTPIMIFCKLPPTVHLHSVACKRRADSQRRARAV